MTTTALVVDAATGNEISRPLTAAESADLKKAQEEGAALAAERDLALADAQAAKASAIQKLTSLGLTEDEANALIGK